MATSKSSLSSKFSQKPYTSSIDNSKRIDDSNENYSLFEVNYDVDYTMTYTTSMKIDSIVDVAFTDTKQKVTCIKDVVDLAVRIEKLEEIFSYLRNRKLKQKKVILGTDDETSSNDDMFSNDEISSSEDLINYLFARDVEWQLPKNTQEEPPKSHYSPIKTEVEEPLPLDIMYPHSHVTSSVMGTNRTGKARFRLRSLGPLKEEMVHVMKPYNMMNVTNDVLCLKASNSGFGCSDKFPVDDEMFLEMDEVVFKIHTKQCLNHIVSEIDEPKWALFYCKPKKSLENGLKLLHTDNDVHSFIDVAVKNGFINFYIAHKKQNLGKYYYKNMEWEEEDAGLRKKYMVTGGRKGKEKVIEDEGICSKGNKANVTIYKRAMVNGKAKMVEDVGVVKREKDRGVVIEDSGFINDGGKETLVTKRAIGSRKIEGKSVKMESE
nr:cytochrome b561/ferric reductase transmembrane [Tanacetum cinerariifolium]